MSTLPKLTKLSAIAKQLGTSTESLRDLLPPDAVYRLGRRWFADEAVVAVWLQENRYNPERSALRQEFCRQAVRRTSALRPDFLREARLREARQAIRRATPGGEA